MKNLQYRAIGIDVGGTKIAAALVSTDGIVHAARLPLAKNRQGSTKASRL